MIRTGSGRLSVPFEPRLRASGGAVLFEHLAGVASYGRAARAIITRVIDDLVPEAPEDGS